LRQIININYKIELDNNNQQKQRKCKRNEQIKL